MPAMSYYVSKKLEEELDERRRVKAESGDNTVSLGISLSKRSQVTQNVSNVGKESYSRRTTLYEKLASRDKRTRILS